MTLKDRRRNRLALEQQAAELVAQQAELQQALRQRKLGPIDYQVVQAELVAARVELYQVSESLAACAGSYSEGGSRMAVRALCWQRLRPRIVDRSPPPWAG